MKRISSALALVLGMSAGIVAAQEESELEKLCAGQQPVELVQSNTHLFIEIRSDKKQVAITVGYDPVEERVTYLREDHLDRVIEYDIEPDDRYARALDVMAKTFYGIVTDNRTVGLESVEESVGKKNYRGYDFTDGDTILQMRTRDGEEGFARLVSGNTIILIDNDNPVTPQYKPHLFLAMSGLISHIKGNSRLHDQEDLTKTSYIPAHQCLRSNDPSMSSHASGPSSHRMPAP